MTDRAVSGELSKTIVVAGAIPADLGAALSGTYSLTPLSDVDDRTACDVMLTTSMIGADIAMFDKLPQLKLVVCQGVGLDRIDLNEAERRGITVRYTAGIMTNDTADMAMALIYATARRIVQADSFVRAGNWLKARPTPSRRVVGKRLGIVGLGEIGRTIATRAEGAGMRVSYSGPNRKADVSYPYFADPAELAGCVDFLVASCAATNQTKGLIGAEVLRRLGPDGIFINVSRGSVVDENALLEVLANGGIAGAGLDVFTSEPGIDARFLQVENVVLQPHAATITTETRREVIDWVANTIDGYFERTSPSEEVSP